jgi:sialate O-acetylesterase
MPARPLLILAGLLASSALAAPTIDPQFGDHAVIQRGKPVLLSGTTVPGGVVMVTFADQTHAAKADSSGRWQADFPARDASEGLQLSVSGSDGSASSTDLAFGDVWLCSGQSNMEYPLRRALNGDGEVQNADDPQLRLMKVPQQLAPAPQQGFAKAPEWRPTTPDSAKDFSAACYFLARELRSTEKVPIGAIDDSWGGTPIRAWMDEGAVRSSGGADAAAVVDLYRSDPTAAVRKFGVEWGAWWRKQTGDKPGKEPWNASDRLSGSRFPRSVFGTIGVRTGRRGSARPGFANGSR